MQHRTFEIKETPESLAPKTGTWEDAMVSCVCSDCNPERVDGLTVSDVFGQASAGQAIHVLCGPQSDEKASTGCMQRVGWKNAVQTKHSINSLFGTVLSYCRLSTQRLLDDLSS